MAYKTPNITSEYIRSIMNDETDFVLADIILEADNAKIPILLPEAAAFTKQLVMLSKPTNVLEIGTAIGYSGSLFLKNSNCKLVTIDKDSQSLLRATHYFDRAGYKGRYQILEGDADEIVPNLKEEFDFIFLDGPKSKYLKYLPFLKQLLVRGGILLADNVLFNGMVANANLADPKKKTIVANLDLFLRTLYSDTDFETSVLNVGDGMSLSIKR